MNQIRSKRVDVDGWVVLDKPVGITSTHAVARLKRIYRYHLLLRAERRDRLSGLLREMLSALDAMGVSRRSVVVDVDAMHLM